MTKEIESSVVRDRPVHALYCKCGVQYQVAKLEHALTDAKYQREVRKCINAGGRYEVFDIADRDITLYDGVCTCGYVKCCTPEEIAKDTDFTDIDQ